MINLSTIFSSYDLKIENSSTSEAAEPSGKLKIEKSFLDHQLSFIILAAGRINVHLTEMAVKLKTEATAVA